MYDVFGMRFTLDISRFVKMMTDPRGLIFLGLGAFLLFAADPNNLRDSIGAPLALLTWFCCVGLYVVTLFFILSAFSLVQHHFGPFLIYTPISSSLGLLFVFVCANKAIATFIDPAVANGIFPLFFNVMGAGIVIETLFVRFVMPMIFAEPEPETHAPTLIRIGDRQFPVTKILHIMSQEHYLQVTVSGETIMIRGRLSDVVAQMTEETGLQPHRSWWVSAVSEPKLERNDGKASLRLNDETQVPIAKARAADVQRWLDLHSDWGGSGASDQEA